MVVTSSFSHRRRESTGQEKEKEKYCHGAVMSTSAIHTISLEAFQGYIRCWSKSREGGGGLAGGKWGVGHQVSSLSKGVGHPIFQPVVGRVTIVSDKV